MLWMHNQTLPAAILNRLRREEGQLRMDWDAAKSASERVEISGPLARIRAQIFEIIGVPKRPASPALKPRGMSNQSQLADAKPIDVDSISDAIPALPAESEE